MLLVGRLARVVRQEDLREVSDDENCDESDVVSEGLNPPGTSSQSFSEWQNDIEGIKLLLNLKLIPLAASPQHLSKLDPRHLCAILSSLAWMRHLILPSHAASSAESSLNAETGSGRFVASTPWVHVTNLIHRASERIHEASADDACRTLWAVAKLAGVKDMPSAEAVDISLDDGGLLVAFARAALRGTWEVDCRGHASLPMPGHLLPTFMWAVSHSMPKTLNQHEIQELLHRLMSPSERLPLPPNVFSAQPTAVRDPSHTSSEGASYPQAPLLIQPEALNAFSAEDLVTLLYAFGRMNGTPNGRAGGIGGQQHDKSGETGGAASAASASCINGDQTSQNAVIEALCSALMDRCTSPSPSSRSSYCILSTRSAANTAWALSRLGFHHPPLLRHLVVCAEGFLRAAQGSPGQLLPVSPFQRQSGVMKQPSEKPRRGGAQTFRPQELANLMSALSRLGVHAPGLVSLVELWVVRHCTPPRPSPMPSQTKGLRPKGSGSHPRGGLQRASDDGKGVVVPGQGSADRLSVRDASELLYALATMSMAPHAAVAAEPTNFPVPLTVAEFIGRPSGDSDADSDADRSSFKGAHARREAAESLAGVVRCDLILQNAVDGEGWRRSHLRSRGPDSPSLPRSGPLGGGHWSRPQLLIGAVWALTRLGAPHAGGLLAAVATSILDQSPPTGTAQGPKPRDPPDLGTTHPRAVGNLAGNEDDAEPLVPLAGAEDDAEPLVPLAALQPEDVARLCWTLASDGSSAASEVAASGTERLEEGALRRRDYIRCRIGALRVLETEAIEWAPSMDDQVGVQAGVM